MGAATSSEEGDGLRRRYETLLRKYNRMVGRAGPIKRITPKHARNTGDSEQAQLHKNDRLYRFLVKGPPRSGTYYIRPEKARAWIDAQITPERRATAQKFIDNMRYVTHEEFIATLRQMIKSNLPLLSAKTTVLRLDIGASKKSNYWVALATRSILWHEHDIEVATVSTYEEAEEKGFTDMVDVDDCGYSGIQTQRIINDVARALMQRHNIRYVDKDGFFYRWGDSEDIVAQQKKALMVPSRYYENFDGKYTAPVVYAHERGFIKTRMRLFRVYCSVEALKAYRSPLAEGNPLVSVTVGVTLPTTEDLFTENEHHIIAHCLCPTNMEEQLPSAMVYFDFKMADDVSTTGYALLASPIVTEIATYERNIIHGDFSGVMSKYPDPEESAVDRPLPEHVDTVGCLITDETGGRRPFDYKVYLDYMGWDKKLLGSTEPEDNVPKRRIPPSWYKHFDFDTVTLNRAYKKETVLYD